MPGAAAFLSLILDRSAPHPQIHMLRDRLRSRQSSVHTIPHIVNVVARAKLAVYRCGRPKVTERISFECRWSFSFGVTASTAALPVFATRMLL